MAQVKNSTFLNQGPLRSGTGRSTIGPRPPPKFGTSNRKPTSRKIFQDSSYGSSASLASSSASLSLSSSTGTLDSTIQNLRLADKPAPRTPSPILESMGEPRTPPNEPILESMGDDGIMAPPALIHSPQPHYYNTVNGPLGYHAQHTPVPSWPNNGFATMNAPPAGYGTVGSHHGHAPSHPQQQQQQHQSYYPQQQQQPWPQPQDQYQQQHQYGEYVQQQNIVTAAAHGYQLVSSVQPAPVTHHAPVPITAIPTSVPPNPHHANTPQMIPPIPPVDIPQYVSYFPPKTELDPSIEEVDKHVPRQPTPPQVTQPQEQRQRPPSPRITIPVNHPPAPTAAPSPPQTSTQSSAHITTPTTSTSLPSTTSFTQDKAQAQNGQSTPSPRSSTPTSGISKLSDRLASFSSTKTSTSSTSRLSELSNLGSIRARMAKLNTLAASATTESPARSASGTSAKGLPATSGSPKASSPSVTATMAVETPKGSPISPPESSPAEASPMETSRTMYSGTSSKSASTTSLDSIIVPAAVPTTVAAPTAVATPTTVVAPTTATAPITEASPTTEAAPTTVTTPTTEAAPATAAAPATMVAPETAMAPKIIAAVTGGVSTLRSTLATTAATSTQPDIGKTGSGSRWDSTKALPVPEKEATAAAAVAKRPISSVGPPVPPPRGGGTYDWRSEWAERRKSVPVSPYSPSFNALRKLNTDKALPPIRPQDERPQQKEQQRELNQDLQQQQQHSVTPMTRLDPTGRRLTTPKTDSISPGPTSEESPVPVSAAANTTGASARVPTPPLSTFSRTGLSNGRTTATSRIDTPPRTSTPPSSARAATPPMAAIAAAAAAAAQLRMPTPPAQAPRSASSSLAASQGSAPPAPAPAPAPPREERRAYNLSDYVYYDHDHDSKCIVESTDTFAEINMGAASVNSDGKVPLEHASSRQQEKNNNHHQHYGNGRNTNGRGLGSNSKPASQQQKLTTAESNFICAGCNESISGMMVTAMGKRWHVDHFICVECGQNLEHVQFFQRDGHPYCHYDYHEKFSARCAHCDTAIENECLTALGKNWHPEHFFCRSCGEPFGEDGYMIHEDRPYCEKDYLRLFAPKCAGCQDAIQGDFINALKNKWHRDCFGCKVCHIGFDHSSYFVRDGEPYCETHYKATKGKAAH